MTSTHWLVLFHRAFVCDQPTRRDAEDFAIVTYFLDREQTAKLRKSLVVTLPRKGLLEVVSCDCTDGKHKEEL